MKPTSWVSTLFSGTRSFRLRSVIICILLSCFTNSNTVSGHHLKKRKDKKLADPKQNGGEQHKCNPGGNTHVRGNVEVDFPPSLKEQHNREQEKHNSREKVRQIVEALTLIGVFAAAGFSYWPVSYTHLRAH